MAALTHVTTVAASAIRNPILMLTDLPRQAAHSNGPKWDPQGKLWQRSGALLDGPRPIHPESKALKLFLWKHPNPRIHSHALARTERLGDAHR